ncbi:unnamed protein product [Ectocarpus sp. 12 AP-2014]
MGSWLSATSLTSNFIRLKSSTKALKSAATRGRRPGQYGSTSTSTTRKISTGSFLAVTTSSLSWRTCESTCYRMRSRVRREGWKIEAQIQCTSEGVSVLSAKIAYTTTGDRHMCSTRRLWGCWRVTWTMIPASHTLQNTGKISLLLGA